MHLKKDKRVIVITIIAAVILLSGGLMIIKSNKDKRANQIEQENLEQMEKTKERLESKLKINQLTIEDVEWYEKENEIAADKATELKNILADQVKKANEENETIYADNIKNLETKYVEFKASGLTGINNDKYMSLHINLLSSKEATQYKCSELIVKEKTNFINMGIRELAIFVDNNGETAGIIIFSLNNGKYEPRVNTLQK